MINLLEKINPRGHALDLSSLNGHTFRGNLKLGDGWISIGVQPINPECQGGIGCVVNNQRAGAVANGVLILVCHEWDHIGALPCVPA